MVPSAFATPETNSSLAKYHELTLDANAVAALTTDPRACSANVTNGTTNYMLLQVVPASANEEPHYTAVPLSGSSGREGPGFSTPAKLLLPAESTATAPLEDSGALSKATVAGLLAALLYGTVAVAMNFVNKWTMELFPLANFVLGLQMLFTLAVLQPLVALRRLPFQPFSWPRARQLALLCQLYTANTAFALYGLRTLNVPMYSTLKRLTPMVVLTTKCILQKKLPNQTVAFAVSLVVLGTVVAGVADLSFDLMGYAFALASVASQAAYLILTEYHASEGVLTSELLYYNSITSLPLLLVIMLGTGELHSLPATLQASFLQFGHAQVIAALAACSVFGALLNYSLFLCTTTNSALTTTIVGVLKGVIAVVLGFFLLGGAPIHPVNIAGISLNTIGGILYTIHKFRSRMVQRTAEYHRTLLASPSQDAMSYCSGPLYSPLPGAPSTGRSGMRGSTGAVQRRGGPAPQYPAPAVPGWSCWAPRKPQADSSDPAAQPLLPRTLVI